jgi:hypothetical protein
MLDSRGENFPAETREGEQKSKPTDRAEAALQRG